MSFLCLGSATPGLSKIERCASPVAVEAQWFSCSGEGAGWQRSGGILGTGPNFAT